MDEDNIVRVDFTKSASRKFVSVDFRIFETDIRCKVMTFLYGTWGATVQDIKMRLGISTALLREQMRPLELAKYLLTEKELRGSRRSPEVKVTPLGRAAFKKFLSFVSTTTSRLRDPTHEK